jgi:hypothetical protein
MWLREFLVVTALTSLALVTVRALPVNLPNRELWRNSDDAKGPREPGEIVALPVLPAPLLHNDKVLGSAYYDTLSVLNVTGPCSNFFGGTSAAVEVFDGLMGNITRHYFSTGVGIRMSGPLTTINNYRTNSAYRLFNEVSININGPFYKRKISNADQTIRGIGSFPPNSREVRVLMLLHELGHLIKGPEGQWLLPDDGNNEELSRANSEKIEDVCGKQIRGLSRIHTLDLAKVKKPKETLALASTISNPSAKN